MNQQNDPIGTVDYRTPSDSELAEMFRKISRVVPDDVDNQLSSIANIVDHLQWPLGDLVNEIFKNVQGSGIKNKRGNPYTFLDVCFYVSAKYLRYSRSFNTVKAWALTARRYSPEVREHYHFEDLPFAHFAYAARKIFDVDSSTGQKRWQDVLDHSIDQMIKLGRLISVTDLEKHFEGRKKATPTYQTGVYEFPSVEVTMAPVVIHDVDPAADVDIDQEFSEVMHKLAGLVSRIVAKHPIVSGVVQQAFAMLSNALQAIRQPAPVDDF